MEDGLAKGVLLFGDRVVVLDFLLFWVGIETILLFTVFRDLLLSVGLVYLKAFGLGSDFMQKRLFIGHLRLIFVDVCCDGGRYGDEGLFFFISLDIF